VNLERIAIEVVAGLLLVWGTVMYLEHRGAAQCRAADAAAVATQEAHNAAQAATDAKTLNHEASTYHEAVSAAPAPTPALVCVRKYTAPRPLSETATAKPRNDGPTDLPKADSGGFDPGPKLTPIGREADARVTYLQSYITDVCRPK
jgi:hypothetical protein